MNAMEDLAAWLIAIWDEEERLAIKAGGDRWIIEGSIVHESRPHDDVVDWVYDEADEHIAYHDPASVLARIAADRKILALHHPDRPLENWYWLERKCAECGHGWHAWTPAETPPIVIGPERGCPTVRLLAEPYKDRPGFRSEWLVERQGVEW